jgi:acetaldehyde dehydrogenase (acetylating)
MDEDLRSIQEVRDLLARAKSAQAILQEFTQEAVDRLVDAVAAAGEREAKRLAALAVEETGYGNVPD